MADCRNIPCFGCFTTRATPCFYTLVCASCRCCYLPLTKIMCGIINIGYFRFYVTALCTRSFNESTFCTCRNNFSHPIIKRMFAFRCREDNNVHNVFANRTTLHSETVKIRRRRNDNFIIILVAFVLIYNVKFICILAAIIGFDYKRAILCTERFNTDCCITGKCQYSIFEDSIISVRRKFKLIKCSICLYCP